VTVSGGSLSSITGSGLTRTATFTPTANTNNGTALITVASGTYTDAAGNNGGAGTTPSLTFDTKAPTLGIASNVSALKGGETATITFTFSEDPGSTFSWDGTSGDVTVFRWQPFQHHRQWPDPHGDFYANGEHQQWHCLDHRCFWNPHGCGWKQWWRRHHTKFDL
jgi:hypothetical protein